MQKASLIFLALLVAVLFSACGPRPQNMQGKNIDGALSKYLDQFGLEASSRGVSVDASNLTMTFSESMPSSSIPNGFVMAYCQRSIQGQSVIVKGSNWNALSVSDREQVIFHELGHCLLGLSHNNTREAALDYYGGLTYATNVPSSIMNELHFEAWLYNANRTAYLDRLFNAPNKLPMLYWNGPSQIDTTIY